MEEEHLLKNPPSFLSTESLEVPKTKGRRGACSRERSGLCGSKPALRDVLGSLFQDQILFYNISEAADTADTRPDDLVCKQ